MRGRTGRRLLALTGPVALIGALCSAPAFAQQAPVTIPPDPERQGIPEIRREQAPVPGAAQGDRADGDALPDQVLPAPVERIDVQSPVLSDEVEAVLRPFIGKAVIPGRDLTEARGEIWGLLRRRGHLARVELNTAPDAGGSAIQAVVHPITVRDVLVEQERGTSLDQSTLDSILADARQEMATGGSLDIAGLDSRIRRRLYLRDVDVRAVLVPAGADQVDVKIMVAAKPAIPVAMVAQLDNYGMKTYGSERMTLGISVPGSLVAGDQIDAMLITSQDMHYGRLAYDVPLIPLGARFNTSGAYVSYRAPSGEKGETWLLGGGLSYPLYIGDEGVLIGHLNYAHRQQEDRLRALGTIADKQTNSVQGKLDIRHYPDASQTLYVTTAVTVGDLDLSGVPSALAQDQVSARTDGRFAKFEWEAGWSALIGPSGKFDVRVDSIGQFASKNLDQSEKFALGGPQGVRAYGPAEGLGDEGFIVNAEAGYSPEPWLRTFAYYGLGFTVRYDRPWVIEPTPRSYTLQAAGAGLSVSHGPMIGSLIYARRIGDNPGQLANGLDSEGMRGRDRLWFTLTLRR